MTEGKIKILNLICLINYEYTSFTYVGWNERNKFVFLWSQVNGMKELLILVSGFDILYYNCCWCLQGVGWWNVAIILAFSK
jgi:hypothetical protein